MNTKFTLILLVVAFATAPLLAQADRGGKSRRSFDVCVDAGQNFSFDDVDGSGLPTAGDPFTAVGGIWPKGSIPLGGVAADCSDIADERIGTFFVNGHFVNPLIPDAQEGGSFPAAAEDDLALVVWHFRVDGKGSVDTIGPVKAVADGESYPQTIVGGTGRFKSAKGAAKTTVLGGGGFQFRLKVR